MSPGGRGIHVCIKGGERESLFWLYSRQCYLLCSIAHVAQTSKGGRPCTSLRKPRT